MYVRFIILLIVVQYSSSHYMENNSKIISRHRRFYLNLLSLFSDTKKTDVVAKDNAVVILGGHSPSAQDSSHAWLNSFKNGTGRLMGGATDLLLLPVKWIGHILDNWYA